MLTKEEIYTNLMKVPEFKNLPPSQIEWMATKGTISIHPDGEQLFKLGDPMNELRILFKGRINLYMEQGGNLYYFDVVEPFEISDLLMRPRASYVTPCGANGGSESVSPIQTILPRSQASATPWAI